MLAVRFAFATTDGNMPLRIVAVRSRHCFLREKRPKTGKNKKKPKKPVETKVFAVDKAAQKPQG
jgi:hypothetical protein